MSQLLDYLPQPPRIPTWAAASISFCVYVAPIGCPSLIFVCGLLWAMGGDSRSVAMYHMIFGFVMILATTLSCIAGILAALLLHSGYRKYLISYILDWFLILGLSFWWWWRFTQ